MPQGDKSAYTDKQKRQAQHIEESYEARGVPDAKAEEIAWATVNKQDGGGNRSGSGRSAAAKKGWETRRASAGGSAPKTSGSGAKTTTKSSGVSAKSKR